MYNSVVNEVVLQEGWLAAARIEYTFMYFRFQSSLSTRSQLRPEKHLSRILIGPLVLTLL